MGAHFMMVISVTRQSRDATPRREPGWYVLDRAFIVATCDTEKEANDIADELRAVANRRVSNG